MKRGTKSHDKGAEFVRALVRYCFRLKKLRPRETFIFNVITKYGSYQIAIGPELSGIECKKMHMEPHSRNVEIHGTMHHLFVNPKSISPTPEQENIRENLRGSVIMKDVVIHIVDQTGNKDIANNKKEHLTYIQPRRSINLAGERGDSLIKHLAVSGRLATETYRIVQEDILMYINVSRKS